MTDPVNLLPGHFCWLDLAAANTGAASDFYYRLFGWSTQTHKACGGHFSSFHLGEERVASLYQLGARHLKQGVPSHWTPYVAVNNVDETARLARSLGASVPVAPFDFPNQARIALLQDPDGAVLGLWQSPSTDNQAG